MKSIEKASDEAGISYLELMENAGAKASAIIAEILKTSSGKEVLILAGSGNNGGDGFVIARNLSDEGYSVLVVITDKEPSTELSLYEYCKLAGQNGVDVLNLNDNIEMVFQKFLSASVIVDAVFGTGFHGELPPALKACFSYASRCQGIKIAIDVPSGGNCLTGEVAEDILKADITITFGFIKFGMNLYPLKEKCGKIICADIGIPDQCVGVCENIAENLDFDSVGEIIPPRKADSHKGTFGKLLNIAGSADMSGAAVLSTLGALRSGAGLVKLCSTEKVVDRTATAVYECTFLTCKENACGAVSSSESDRITEECLKNTAVTIGCGLTNCNDTKNIVEAIINSAECPIILDADGINCIADNIDIIKNTKNKLIITPHPGELGRLLGKSAKETAKDRYSAAVELSSVYKIIVVAKGVPTIVAGDGKVYVCRTGNSGLSRGGSGDVLTGIIGALVAQGINPLEAAAAGVLIHGRCAERVAERTSMLGMLPTDVINELPYVFGELNCENRYF